MNSVPRVALLGASHWHTPRQVESFLRAGARIVAVQDSNAMVADRWGRSLGCDSHTEVEAAVTRRRLDLVLVLSPNDQVPGVLQTLIALGLPFAIEKPGALDADALTDACLASESRGLLTSVAFVNRFSEFWATADRMKHEGLLESVVSARFRLVNGTPQRYLDDGVGWVLRQGAFGGGALRNIGSHAADAVVRLVGTDAEILGATVASNAYGFEVEDHAVALLRSADRTAIVLEAGYVHPARDGTDHEWSIAGPKLQIIESESTLRVVSASGTETLSTPDVQGRYDLFAADVLRALRAGEMSRVPLRAAFDALSLIDRIYLTASSMTATTVANP